MNLKVSGQSIEWLDETLTVSGSDGIYQIEFTFVDVEGLPSWSDLSKYAVFKNSSLPQYDNGVYAVITDGVADIPACILTEPGKLSVGVYGQNGYYTMPTIWAEPVKMQAGCAEGEAAVPSVMTSAQNAIKYGENAKVFAEGGYPVRKVGGTVDDPEIERLPDYVKGAKQYAQEAAGSAESAAGDAEDAARDALKSEGYAVGEQDGEAVASDSPYYHNNAKYYNQQAAGHDDAAGSSANAAAGSATEAESYAKGGTSSRTGEDTDNAKYYKEQAASSEQNASQAAGNAEADALKAEGYAVGKQDGADVGSDSPYYHANAKYYKEQAASSEQNASQSASDAAGAKTDAETAKTDAVAAKNAAVDAKTDAQAAAGAASGSATSAGNSAAAALASAKDSEAYAIGKRAGADVPPTDPAYHNNAEYYAAQAAEYAAEAQSAISDGNFMLTDKDHSNTRYIMGFYTQNKHLCMDLTEFTE